MLALALRLDRPGERRDSEERPEREAEKAPAKPRACFDRLHRLRLAEREVALFLLRRAPQDGANLRVLDGVDEGVGYCEHVALAQRHFQTYVLRPVVSHHPRGEEAHCAASRDGGAAQTARDV